MSSRADVYQATDGAAYEVFLGRRSRRLAERLLDFAAFADDGALLDVGCGTGSLTGTMAARWPQRRIVGVDFSEAFLAFARSRGLGEAVVFEHGDATALPYDDGAFTGCATQLVLNFISNCDAAVAEMRRVTRRDGIVAAAVLDFRGGAVFHRRDEGVVDQYPTGAQAIDHLDIELVLLDQVRMIFLAILVGRPVLDGRDDLALWLGHSRFGDSRCGHGRLGHGSLGHRRTDYRSIGHRAPPGAMTLPANYPLRRETGR